MYKFLYLLKPTTDQINELSEGIKTFNNDGHGNYQLSDFTTYILAQPLLFNLLYLIKTQIITLIIKKEIYTIIKKKISYYRKFVNDEEVIQPKESCCQSFQRRFFTDYPPKYYYNYCPFYHKRNGDDLLFVVRQRYGYSVRINRVSSNTSHESQNNGNVIHGYKSTMSTTTSRSQLYVRTCQTSSEKLHKLTFGERVTPLSPLSIQNKAFF